MELQEKILSLFNGKVVRKDLAFFVKGNLPVPTYVIEYLLGQYCASDDPQIIEEGVEKVKSIIRNNYISRAEADLIKGKIREKGSHVVIDKITAVLNDKQDQYEVSFANLGLTKIPIGDNVIQQNPKLLSGNGVWSIVRLNYLQGEDIRIRWEIQSLKPIQISNINLDEFISQREKFTTEEWIDFLIHTVGLNPEPLNRREKFIALARLLPHIENNYNFMELGPKGTGKSHVYQEFSPYGVLVSGGDVTSARLFVKMSGNKEILGLVGYWDVVTWDEYEQKPHRSIEAKMVDAMQNYLANKSFNRGKATHESTASMSFVGNTKHTVPYMLKNTHLFESIPSDFLQTGAFLDRIHLYNPGWEVKVLKKNSFSAGYGLITDYISAILHEMRNIDFSSKINEYARFSGTLSERDHNAIRKTFSGLCKLLYPNGIMTESEIREIIDFAAEGRKRVKDQLYVVDNTFCAEPAYFEYTWLKTGETVKVETLENIEHNHKSKMDSLREKDRQDEDAAGGELPDTTSALPYSSVKSNEATPSEQGTASLAAKVITIRENQGGVTYRSLFGDYLQDAKSITVVDPFIRYPYQIDNFVDFVQMVKDVSKHSEELKIHLSTQNDDDEKVAELIDIFNELADDMALYGIEFTYDFLADHDRAIKTDSGWIIGLGRGLDIFEKYSRFSLGRCNQTNRRCKATNISINRIENEPESISQ